VRLLIVEKDETLNELIKLSVNEIGYKSDEAFTIKDGKYFLDIRNYNLLIVDLSFGLSEVFKFIDYAKYNGADRIYLEVSVKRLEAIKFYRKFGFKIVSKIDRYYNDGSDAYIMELHIK